MKIITFNSSNAPPEKAWVAYWLVPVKEPKITTQISPDYADPALDAAEQAKPSKEGIMPYSFWGTSEDEALTKAQAAWDTSFGKEEKLQKDLATVRTRKRA
jgi:hypothetical protein